MTAKYTHLELDKEVSALAGYYIPEAELRLKYNGREVLYVVGQVVVESACQDGTCSTGNWWYAIVPGYLLKWQNKRNEAGLPVSEVEPISDEETRANIKRMIQTKESASLIEFW